MRRFFIFVGLLACSVGLGSATAHAKGEAWKRKRVVIFWADSRSADCVKERDLLYLHSLIEERLHKRLPPDRFVVIKGADLISLVQAFSGDRGDRTACQDQTCTQIANKAQADLYLEQSFHCPASFSLKLYERQRGASHLQSLQKESPTFLAQLGEPAGQKRLEAMVDKLAEDLGVQLVAERSKDTTRRSRVQVIANPDRGSKRGTVGVMVLDCNVPGARVSLDGRERGKTDRRGFFQVPLQVGSYDLAVEHPHYDPVRQAVKIQPGAVQVQAHLEARFGRLKVITEPAVPAVVKLNGSEIGKPPVRQDHLLEGDYNLSVTHPSYAPVNRQIRIRRQSTQTVKVRLKRLEGQVVLMSNPSEAKIRLQMEGEQTVEGRTPMAGVFVPTGTWTMTTGLKGYAVDERKVVVRADRTLQSTVALKPAVSVRLTIEGPAAGKGWIQWLDGKNKPIGRLKKKSPATFDLGPGRHRFSAAYKGFMTETVTLTVAQDAIDRTITLKTGPKLELSVKPRSATVRVNGEDCPVRGGVCRLDLKAASARVLVEAEGYDSHSFHERIQAGGTYKKSVTLRKNRAGRQVDRKRREMLESAYPRGELRMQLPRYVFGQQPNALRGPGHLQLSLRQRDGPLGFRSSLISEGVGLLGEQGRSTWLQFAGLLRLGASSRWELGFGSEVLRMGEHQATGSEADWLDHAGIFDVSAWASQAWGARTLAKAEFTGTVDWSGLASAEANPTWLKLSLRSGWERLQLELAYHHNLSGTTKPSSYQLGLDYVLAAYDVEPAWEEGEVLDLSGISFSSIGASYMEIGPWKGAITDWQLPTFTFDAVDDYGGIGIHLGGEFATWLKLRPAGIVQMEARGGYKYPIFGIHGPFMEGRLGLEFIRGGDVSLSCSLLYRAQFASLSNATVSDFSETALAAGDLETRADHAVQAHWEDAGPGLRCQLLEEDLELGMSMDWYSGRGGGRITRVGDEEVTMDWLPAASSSLLFRFFWLPEVSL